MSSCKFHEEGVEYDILSKKEIFIMLAKRWKDCEA